MDIWIPRCRDCDDDDYNDEDERMKTCRFLGFRKLKKSIEPPLIQVNGFINTHNQTNLYSEENHSISDSIIDRDSCNFLMEYIKKPFDKMVQLERKAITLSQGKKKYNIYCTFHQQHRIGYLIPYLFFSFQIKLKHAKTISI